jgi:hypothetical protein
MHRFDFSVGGTLDRSRRYNTRVYTEINEMRQVVTAKYMKLPNAATFIYHLCEI